MNIIRTTKAQNSLPDVTKKSDNVFVSKSEIDKVLKVYRSILWLYTDYTLSLYVN